MKGRDRNMGGKLIYVSQRVMALDISGKMNLCVTTGGKKKITDKKNVIEIVT